jgi:CBS domain
VRRMPVFSRDNAPIGIISLDDVAAHVQADRTIAEALRQIARISRATRTV